MNLRHITSTKCPECGETEIVKESREQEYSFSTRSSGKIRRHCNGEEWESREFLCGYVIKWIPNFSKEMKGHGCPRDPAYIAARNRLEVLKADQTALNERVRAAESEAFSFIRGVD